MLRLIYGGFGSGKSTRVNELIQEAIDGTDKYKKSVYLIVPEQDTVRAELEAARDMPPLYTLTFEVQNFSRLANTVFRSLGGLCYNYADSQSKALCMWQSIRSIGGIISEPMLELDESRINAMLSVMSELRASGVATGELEGAAQRLCVDTPLGRELYDLSAILTVYESVLEQKYTDSEKDLDRLCSILEQNRFFSGCDIFIDGFMSYTAPQMKVIKRLIADANTVTVTLPCDRTRGSYSYTAESEHVSARLISYAQELGVECVCEDMGDNLRGQYADIRYVADHLYRKGSEVYDGECGHVRFYECSDAREEAEAVACFIKEKVQTGSRYRDIAVVARNADDYAGILDAAFARHDIPCFFSCEVKAESHPAVKLLYGAFYLYIKNCRREDVISYLKTGLCGVTAQDCDLFEKYVNTWKINGRRFMSDVPFSSNPAGYTDKMTKQQSYILDCSNRVKDTLIDQLSGLFASLDGEHTVREISRSVWEFMEKLGIEQKLESEARAAMESGDEQAARESEGIYKCIADTLDTIVDTAADEKVDAPEYLRLLKMCLRSKTVSVIPTSADAVTVGSAHMLRTSGISHVFVIGACEGSFPMPIKDVGYFDNVKRKKLSEVGIDILRDVEREYSNELFFYVRAVCSASESVTVTFPSIDVNASAAKISGSTQKLMELLGTREAVRFGSLSVKDRVYDAAALAEMAMTADIDTSTGQTEALLCLAREGELDPYELERVLSPELTEQMYHGKLSMTQSRIESYAKCHFMYLCKYILKLEDAGTGDFSPSDIGNFVHDVLDKLTGELTVDGKFTADIPKQELDSRIDRISGEYLSRVLPEQDAKSARLMSVMRRIRRSVGLICENICHEFEQSYFTPVAHEMKFLDDSPLNPTPLEFSIKEGVSLSLWGILDRADVYRRDGDVYVRVIDYKTGAKDFSLDDIKVGLNLQLMIYLFTLCAQKGDRFREFLGCSEDGRILPAGMLYYSAAVGDVLIDSPCTREQALATAEKGLTRKGLLTCDESILRAMEPDLLKRYIPVSQGKTNLKAERGVKLVDPDEFASIEHQMTESIRSIALDMCEGKIDASPLEYKGMSPCRYCSARVICRRCDGASEAISPDDFEND